MMLKKRKYPDTDQRFFPRIEVSLPVVLEVAGTTVKTRSRNISVKGIEVDLTRPDVELINNSQSAKQLWPMVLLRFGDEATGSPLDDMTIEAEMFTSRRLSQQCYVAFFRFAGVTKEFAAILDRAVKQLSQR